MKQDIPLPYVIGTVVVVVLILVAVGWKVLAGQQGDSDNVNLQTAKAMKNHRDGDR